MTTFAGPVTSFKIAGVEHVPPNVIYLIDELGKSFVILSNVAIDTRQAVLRWNAVHQLSRIPRFRRIFK